MRRNLKLFIALLFGVMATESLHAEPDELQRYLASIAQERDSINVTNADAYFLGSRLAPIEGVWRISGSEGVFAIIADPATIFYKLIVVDSPDQNIIPGTVMGACTETGRLNHFDARIFTKGTLEKMSSPRRFTISLSQEGRLIIVPVIDKLKFNLWRLLPYMFRNSVRHVNNRPDNLDGAIKIFPSDLSTPLAPRYL